MSASSSTTAILSNSPLAGSPHISPTQDEFARLYRGLRTQSFCVEESGPTTIQNGSVFYTLAIVCPRDPDTQPATRISARYSHFRNLKETLAKQDFVARNKFPSYTLFPWSARRSWVSKVRARQLTAWLAEVLNQMGLNPPILDFIRLTEVRPEGRDARDRPFQL
eukprot:c116_g1_i1.p1 GENE.c116_g1_i1~~c116_g1_i1.p1  ORF type:complete len:174 (+),score=27.66 c116_g1_i1:29-523(+)